MPEGEPSKWFKFTMWLEDDVLPYNWVHFYKSHDIFHPSRIYRKIENVIRWAPLLWNDVDWDYVSLLDMMRQKVKYMREHQRDHANHTDYEQIMGQMKSMEDALERLIKNDYVSEDYDKHREKFPERESTLGPDGNYHMAKMSDEEAKSVRSLHKIEEALIQEDLEEIGKILREHVRGWWD
jgi:hypothetical protein